MHNYAELAPRDVATPAPHSHLAQVYDAIDDSFLQGWENSCQYFMATSLATCSILGETIHDWQRVAYTFLNDSQRHDPAWFRRYIHDNFTLVALRDPAQPKGIMTGYFLPELEASLKKSKEFCVPVYRRPKNLIVIENLGQFHPLARGLRIAGIAQNGTLMPYWTRQEITQGALDGQKLEIAWLKDPLDAFIMHVQGSGRLRFANGDILHIGYDGSNGYPYTSIGQMLMSRGAIAPHLLSLESIKDWLRAHPDQQESLLNLNQSYIFFRVLEETTGPQGALKSPLIPHVSVAVDPDFVPLGAMVCAASQAMKVNFGYAQKLVIAQDVGGAIKGPCRMDYYWGAGPKAELRAGQTNADLTLTVLLPKVGA